MRQRCRCILSILLLVLFMGYYVGGVAFPHVHKVGDTLIVHSHPYLPTSQGAAGHTHTAAAFSTIAVLTGFVATLDEPFGLLLFLFTLCVLPLRCSEDVAAGAQRCVRLRGPPERGCRRIAIAA